MGKCEGKSEKCYEIKKVHLFDQKLTKKFLHVFSTFSYLIILFRHIMGKCEGKSEK